MACDIRTLAVLQGSFLIPVLLIISCFHGIYSQSSGLPGNPLIAGEFEKNEGELVTLSCTSLGGNPLPSVRWFKGTQLVDPGSSPTGNGDGQYTVGSSTVTYNNYTFTVSRSDNLVNYVCQVENSQTTAPLTRVWTISIYVPSEQPIITGPEPAVTTALNAGSTYKYVCTARNGRPAPAIRWKLGTSLSTAIEFHQGIAENTTTNSDSTLSKTSSLSWVPITDDNGKNLYCQTDQTTAGSGTTQKSTFVSIVVQQIPILSIGSSSYTVQVGGTVTLACQVLSATPAITNVFWRKLVNGAYTNVNIDNIRFFGGTISNANLTITNVVLTDQTSYQCSATNSAGTGNSGATTLTVSGTLPTVQVGSSTYSGISGSSVTLVCSIISANPSATSVRWEKDVNGAITDVRTFMASRISGGSVNQPSLTISSLTGSDSGTYYCSAANTVGTGSRSATTLTVQNRPIIILPAFTYNANFGQDVTLQCNVTSDSTLNQVTWRKYINGSPNVLVVSGSAHYSGGTTFTPSLTIRTLSFSDSGNYDCSATNVAGTSTSNQMTLNVIGTVPSVNIQSTSYSVTYGGTVTLECVVNSNPFQNSVEWQRIANGVSTTIIVSQEPRYSGGTVNSPSLIISGAVSGDSGVYVCSATNDAGKGVSGQTVLTVQGSMPSVSIPQSTYNVNFGDPITIPCNVTAVPRATNVSWVKTSNGVTVTVDLTSQPSKYSGSTVSNPNLTISSTDLTDEGNYVCSASNIVGTGSSNAAFLDVIGDVPSVSVSQTSYSIFVGSSVTMNCFVSGNPAVSFVYWSVTRNGFTQTAQDVRYSNGNVNNPSLTISNARQSDSGVFVCVAQNSAGTTNSSAISLTVSGSTPTVTMGQSSYSVFTNGDVTLSCSVSANPSATISWTFTSNSGGVTQITTSSSKYSLSSSTTASSLTVRSANSNDQGSYVCSATNSVGTGQATATLVVSGSLPSLTLQSTHSAITGNDIVMTCSVSANPAVSSVSWQFQSSSSFSFTTITSSSKYSISSTTGTSSLTVRSVASSDNGQYRCQATNQVGTSQSTTTLTVSGSIPVVTLPVISYQQTYGQNVTIQCSVTATPAISSVLWQRLVNGNYVDITTLSSTKYYGGTLTNYALTITNLVFTDNGQYRCTATNQVGRGVSPNTANLQVLGGAPTPNIPLTTYSVLIGNNVEIPCSVTATPPVTSVQWRFTSSSGNTIPITQSTSKYTVGSDMSAPNLTVNSAALSDAGSYACSATNIVGTGSDTATLTITGIIPNVTIPDTSLSVQKRQNITITCNITDALPKETSVLWEFRANQGDSGTIISIDANPTKYLGGSVAVPSLTILSVAASDEGYYTCVASNVFGEGRSELAFLEATGNAATVTVSPASQAVIQKNTATISCAINNANPAVIEVTWEKVSSGVTTPVTVTGRFNGSTPAFPDLVISDLQPSDAGTYYCSARNAIGTTKSSSGSVLQVTGAVPFNVQISGSTSRTVTLGGSLTLQCSAQGDPSPTLTWFFRSSNANAAQVGTGTTYDITNAQRTNGGTYICRASNSLGSLDSNGVNVDVQYGPLDVRTEAQKQVSAAVGSTVTLVCEVDANPSASYQWYRSNVQVSSQKEYTFSLSSLALLGSYTCRASNSLGTQDLRFTVSQAVSGNTGASTVSTGLSTGEIAAIVLAVLLLLILIIIIIICCLTHGACGVICGKKQDVKGRVEPTKEKEVYRETQKEVIIPRFHEESIKGKSYRAHARAGSYRSFPPHAAKYRQPSAVSRKDVDVRVQNGGFRRENDYEIVRYETVPAAPPISTQYITESPRPHHLPALSYTYEDVEKKRKKRRKKKKHHHRRHHGDTEEVVVETVRSASPVRILQEPVEEVVVERVIRSRSASPTRIIRTEAEQPTQVVERVIRAPSPSRVYRQEIDEPVIIETRRSSRSPQRYRQENDEEMIIEQRRSPSTRRRHEENYITEERYSTGDDGDLRAINGVVYREAPSRHSGGRYTTHSSSERRSRSRSGRRDRGSDDDLEVVYGKEYVVER